MNYKNILDQINADIKPLLSQGHVADYIPALARVNPNQFAISLLLTDKLHKNDPIHQYNSGHSDVKFSIQSISKVLTLSLVMSKVENENQLWQRVGKEPSGMAFNSLIQLEMEGGIARNPLINAGSIIVADFLTSLFDDPISELKQFVGELVGHEVNFDVIVAASEKHTGYRNFSLAYLMKSFKNIDNNVERVLDVYFNQCSICMNTQELSQAFAFLANDGINPLNGKRVVSERQSRRINALMLTCGTYDRAGQFAFHVGLPAKSGVGGGIVAVVPDTAIVSVWSPALGTSGNSVAGLVALEKFVQQTHLGIF